MLLNSCHFQQETEKRPEWNSSENGYENVKYYDNVGFDASVDTTQNVKT